MRILILLNLFFLKNIKKFIKKYSSFDLKAIFRKYFSFFDDVEIFNFFNLSFIKVF